MNIKKILVLIIISLAAVCSLSACSLFGNVPAEKTESDIYTAPDGEVYLYKLTLQGRFLGASRNARIVIYANDDSITFEQVAKSILSSDYEESSLISECYFVSIELIE